MSSLGSESSSYSDPWVAPSASLGLFTTVTTFRRGDLVKVVGDSCIYRVTSLKITQGKASADLTLREIVSSAKMVVSTTRVRLLGREVETSRDYESGFDPGVLARSCDRYLFLVGGQTYQVLLTMRKGPMKVSLTPVGRKAKAMVEKLRWSGWDMESSRRRGGSVVVCIRGTDRDPFETNAKAQVELYKGLKKARKGRFGRPEAVVIAIITGQSPSYGRSSLLEAYSAKYLGMNVFFFSVSSQPSKRQKQAILGLSAIGRDVVSDLTAGRLEVPWPSRD